MYDPHIRSHARHRPNAVAFASLHGEVTYARFDTEIDRIAQAIHHAGCGEVKLAAVAVAEVYAHWLILLALGRLGIASVTVGALGPEPTITLLNADLLITDKPVEALCQRILTIDKAWVDAAFDLPGTRAVATPNQPDALARVTLSSGTTGTPKIIGRTWCELSALVSSSVIRMKATSTKLDGRRCLYMFGADTAVYYNMLAEWVEGGTMLIGSSEIYRDAKRLAALRPTEINGSALQLQMLVDTFDDELAPMPGLTIGRSGSSLPARVSTALRLRLTTNVWTYYGSSEAGLVARGQVAMLGEDCAGWIEPDVRVETVGEDDEPLPLGAIGALRVKTPNMVTSYLADDDTDTDCFRNGWFYPGDIGSVSSDGLLKVFGRTGEVINIGGVKILPRRLEDAVLACKGVLDAAAFVTTDGSGVPVPWLAIVRDDSLDEGEIETALKVLQLPPIHLGWVAEIPRNARGKVERHRLEAAAQQRP